jgi:hypothetical protein
MLSQYTAVICPILQHTGLWFSSSYITQDDFSCKPLCCVLETILLLVALLWKAHFSLPFCKTPGTTLMAKPLARLHVTMLESWTTLFLSVHMPSHGANLPPSSTQPLVKHINWMMTLQYRRWTNLFWVWKIIKQQAVMGYQLRNTYLHCFLEILCHYDKLPLLMATVKSLYSNPSHNFP